MNTVDLFTHRKNLGEICADYSHTYGWTPLDELQVIDGGQETCQYDAQGKWLLVTDDADRETQSVYEGETLPYRRFSEETGNPPRVEVYLGGLLLARLSDDDGDLVVHYIQCDHLGSPVAITDGNQAVVRTSCACTRGGTATTSRSGRRTSTGRNRSPSAPPGSSAPTRRRRIRSGRRRGIGSVISGINNATGSCLHGHWACNATPRSPIPPPSELKVNKRRHDARP